MTPTKMLTPQQHAWFHDHRPDRNLGECCWCVHERELQQARSLIEQQQAEIEELHEYKEKIYFIGKHHAELTFEGVEAEHVEGGSIVKDLWRVDCGVRYDSRKPEGQRETPLVYEAYGLCNAIDVAMAAYAAMREDPS